MHHEIVARRPYDRAVSARRLKDLSELDRIVRSNTAMAEPAHHLPRG
jgi:hypothetical protein